MLSQKLKCKLASVAKYWHVANEVVPTAVAVAVVAVGCVAGRETKGTKRTLKECCFPFKLFRRVFPLKSCHVAVS